MHQTVYKHLMTRLTSDFFYFIFLDPTLVLSTKGAFPCTITVSSPDHDEWSVSLIVQQVAERMQQTHAFTLQ